MLNDERLLGGRYRLGSRLGRGGMGEVRLGLDVRLGRAVAIKMLTPDLAGDSGARERFQREARSAARLNHPAIVAVFDTGEAEDPLTQVTTPYIVMELVEGQTLGTLLRHGEPVPSNRALQLIEGVLEALAHSHEAGIVHQDIKPGNVMLDQSGDVKVMDFGIARSLSDGCDSSTPAPTVYGSARDLSPEQARGETTDMRSDLYSCGCLLYELLAGRPPFVGADPLSITVQHLHEAPVPPSHRNPAVHPEVDAVVLRALAKGPEDRFQSAQEMRAEVGAVRQRIAEPTPASAVTAVQMRDFVSRVAGPPLRGVRARTRPRRAVASKSPSHRRRAALATAALTAVALPLGGFGLYSVNQPNAAEAEGARVSGVLQAPKAQADVRRSTAAALADTRTPAVSSGTAASAAARTEAASRVSPSATRAARPVKAMLMTAAGHDTIDTSATAAPVLRKRHPQSAVDATATPTQQPVSAPPTATTAPSKHSTKRVHDAPAPVAVQPTSAPSSPAPAPSRSPRVSKSPRSKSPRSAPPPPRNVASPAPTRPSAEPTHPSKPASPPTSPPAPPQSHQPVIKSRPVVHRSHGQGLKRGHAVRAHRQRVHLREHPRGGSTTPRPDEQLKPAKAAKKAKSSRRLKHQNDQARSSHRAVPASGAKATKTAPRPGRQRPKADKPIKRQESRPSKPHGHGKGHQKDKP